MEEEEERGGLWAVLGRSAEVLTEEDGLVREAERPAGCQGCLLSRDPGDGAACVVSARRARREGAKGRPGRRTQEGRGPRHAEGRATEESRAT